MAVFVFTVGIVGIPAFEPARPDAIGAAGPLAAVVPVAESRIDTVATNVAITDDKAVTFLAPLFFDYLHTPGW